MIHSMLIRSQLIQKFRGKKFPVTNTLTTKRSNHSYSSSYSSLYVSAKYGQEIMRVVQPRYDEDYLNYVGDNLEQLFQQRSIEHDYGDYDEIRKMLKDFLRCVEQTEALKKKKNRLILKLKKSTNDDQKLDEQYRTLTEDLNKYRENLYALEERVIPILLNIPNQVDSGITAQHEILDQWKQSDGNNFETGSHSYVRLGYINNLYQRSIVGPNANYLLDKGALLYHGLIDMISDQLQQNGYIPINGLDLVKSAIVEAVNSRHFATDPYMLRVGTGQDEDNQRLHLVGEASLESLSAFIAKHPIENGKLYQVGSCYETDSLNQQHIIRATVITDPNESEKMMKDLYQFCWAVLSKIGVQRCCIRADIKSLYHNEYDKYVLLAWLKNRAEWIQVGQVSNYHHYIHQRLGLAKYHCRHLISSSIDLIPLIYCIVEQYQVFETGQVKIPPEISKIFL